MKTKLLAKIRKRFSINYFNDEWHIIDFKTGEFITEKLTYYAAYYMCRRLGHIDYANTSLARRSAIVEVRLKKLLNDNRRSISGDYKG